MKNLILSICTVLCAFFVGTNAYALTITTEMLPEFVAQMQAQLPQNVETGMVWKAVSLENSNSEVVFYFTINENEFGVTSEEYINECESWSPAQKKEYLGEEFAQIVPWFPVPLYAVFLFDDGKSYKMKLSD